MAKSDDLKKAMALPPIPQAPKKSHKGRHNRTRIRLEISRNQCEVLLSMLAKELSSITILDASFRDTYTLYSGLRTQMDKAKSSAG